MPNPRMIMDDVLFEMRKHGMSMSKTTLVEGIQPGVFPFAHLLDGTCVIMRKDFEDWAKDYLIPYDGSDGRTAE